MNPIKFFNERVKLFTIWDIKLAQTSAIAFMIILIKLIPQIISISIGWFVGICILAGLRPMYAMFIKKAKN